MPDLIARRPVPLAGGRLMRLLQWPDLPQIESLIQRCQEADQTWTQRTLSRALTRWPTSEDRAIVGVLEDAGAAGDGRLLAIAAIAPDLGQWGCADAAVLVDVEQRGHGLGIRLMAAALQLSGALGYRAVSARVTRENLPFLRIAERLGLARQDSVGAEPLLLRGAPASGQSRRATRVRMS